MTSYQLATRRRRWQHSIMFGTVSKTIPRAITGPISQQALCSSTFGVRMRESIPAEDSLETFEGMAAPRSKCGQLWPALGRDSRSSNIVDELMDEIAGSGR